MIMDQTSPQNPPGPHPENFIPQPSAAMIPPPPPLPPRPPIQAYKPPRSIGLTPPIPPLHLGVLKIVDCLENQESANAIESNRPFQPCLMFFYGSLMDPEVVQAVLNLPELPSTKPATIFGFRIKMWGIYPALIPSTSGQVAGFVWEVDSEEHFERLAAYETAAYTWVECEAVLDEGTVCKDCRTFCWAGNADSNELEDGCFDLERYQKYFKSSVTRRRLSAS
jgi:gamma-glutamylcyclotransferase (GGCT)/AIG2-like uncharacterized protein YtfP